MRLPGEFTRTSFGFESFRKEGNLQKGTLLWGFQESFFGYRLVLGNCLLAFETIASTFSKGIIEVVWNLWRVSEGFSGLLTYSWEQGSRLRCPYRMRLFRVLGLGLRALGFRAYRVVEGSGKGFLQGSKAGFCACTSKGTLILYLEGQGT